MMKLFRSHKEGFKDGEQLRDFVYVKDVVNVIAWMMEDVSRQSSVGSSTLTPHASRLTSAIYNLGTGKARSFHDLVAATFKAPDLETKIEFIDMPEDIRDKYQYFTEANMEKLKLAGYKGGFTNLEDGVQDYVVNYLQKGLIY